MLLYGRRRDGTGVGDADGEWAVRRRLSAHNKEESSWLICPFVVEVGVA